VPPPPPGGASSVPPPPPYVSAQPPARRRSKGKVIGAVVGVVALVGAGTFAVAAMTGGSDGGAATPQEAVQQLIASVNQEDAIGAMDYVLPGERDTFKQPVLDVISELKRLEVLDSSADAAKVAGIDIDIQLDDIPDGDVDKVADDIANVKISGTAKATVDQKELPIGDLLLDNLGDAPDGSSSSDGEFGKQGDDVRITTVEKDGRWYVSAFYSIAEQAREEVGADVPAKDEAIAPAGASSPEEAMNAVFDSVEQLDLERLIAVVNPNEAEALQRYAPLFLDDAQKALDQAKDDSGLEIKIDDPEYKVSKHGDSAGVIPTKLHATVEVEGGSLELDHKCVTVTSPEGDTQNSCDDADATIEDVLGSADLPDSVRKLIDDVRDAFDDFSSEGITVDQVDGKWYVSPIGTSFDLLLSGLKALDRSEIDTLVDDIQNAQQDAIDEIDEATSDDSDTNDTTDTTVETGTTDQTDTTDATDTTNETVTTDETATTDQTESTDAFTVCMEKLDADAAKQCVEDGLADGSIDPTTMPAELRFPECGLSDLFWGGVEDLSDDEFVGTIEAANDCYQGKVDGGELDESEVPLDAAHTECLTGVNPYTASQDVLETYLDCIGA
jgi:hypothetical protein